jgi:hypothetical protein
MPAVVGSGNSGGVSIPLSSADSFAIILPTVCRQGGAMPTPQFNIRVPEQYHGLLRLIVERLRANPDGADALAAALTAVCRQSASRSAIGADSLPAAGDSLPSAAVSNRLDAITADVEDLKVRIALLPEILDRLTREEEFSRKVLTFAETINDGLVKDREARVANPSASTAASGVSAKPRPDAASNRSIPVEHLEEAARLWDGGKGSSIAKIITAKGWTYNRAGLHKAVKRYLDQSSGQAEPVSHVDENPEPPVESSTE